MKHLLMIAILMASGHFACAQQAIPQVEKFLVYSISSRVTGFGQEHAENQFDENGETANTWRGKLLVDLNSNKAAIIWYTRLYNEKVHQVISFGFTLRRQNVNYSRSGRVRDVFSMTSSSPQFQSGFSETGLPASDAISAMWLYGSPTRTFAIGGEDEDDNVVTAEFSPSLYGEFQFLNEGTESYREGRIAARYNHLDSVNANTKLLNYDNSSDGFIDLNDLIQYWKDSYVKDQWLPIGQTQ